MKIVIALLALWLGTNAALVTHAPGCLFRGPVLVRCYAAAGVDMVGGAQSDALYRPSVGDIYTLRHFDGTIEQTTLRGVTRLPIVLH